MDQLNPNDVKRVRTEMGLSLQAVSEKAMIPIELLTHFEMGRELLDKRGTTRLAKLLNLNPVPITLKGPRRTGAEILAELVKTEVTDGAETPQLEASAEPVSGEVQEPVMQVEVPVVQVVEPTPVEPVVVETVAAVTEEPAEANVPEAEEPVEEEPKKSKKGHNKKGSPGYAQWLKQIQAKREERIRAKVEAGAQTAAEATPAEAAEPPVEEPVEEKPKKSKKGHNKKGSPGYAQWLQQVKAKWAEHRAKQEAAAQTVTEETSDSTMEPIPGRLTVPIAERVAPSSAVIVEGPAGRVVGEEAEETPEPSVSGRGKHNKKGSPGYEEWRKKFDEKIAARRALRVPSKTEEAVTTEAPKKRGKRTKVEDTRLEETPKRRGKRQKGEEEPMVQPESAASVLPEPAEPKRRGRPKKVAPEPAEQLTVAETAPVETVSMETVPEEPAAGAAEPPDEKKGWHNTKGTPGYELWLARIREARAARIAAKRAASGDATAEKAAPIEPIAGETKRRGRKLGSKNKPKVTPIVETVATPAPETTPIVPPIPAAAPGLIPAPTPVAVPDTGMTLAPSGVSYTGVALGPDTPPATEAGFSMGGTVAAPVPAPAGAARSGTDLYARLASLHREMAEVYSLLSGTIAAPPPVVSTPRPPVVAPAAPAPQPKAAVVEEKTVERVKRKYTRRAVVAPVVPPSVTEKVEEEAEETEIATEIGSVVDYLKSLQVKILGQREMADSEKGFMPVAVGVAQKFGSVKVWLNLIRRNLNQRVSIQMLLREMSPDQVNEIVQISEMAKEYRLINDFEYHAEPIPKIYLSLPTTITAMNFFAGQWLRYYVYSVMQKLAVSSDASLSFIFRSRLSLKDDDHPDLDVVGYVNGKPFWIQLHERKDFYEQLNRYSKIRGALGIDIENSFLLCPDFSEDDPLRTREGIKEMNAISLADLPRVLQPLFAAE